jgi:fused signal recognition particle receptor
MNERSWIGRLRAGLSKSSSKLAGGIAGILTSRKLDQSQLDQIEDLLITADLGPTTAATLVDGLRKRNFPGETDEKTVREALAEDIQRLLEPIAKPLEVQPGNCPHVILVAGVNGTGKTTTIGKIAKQFVDQGHTVMLAAGDTFRAAAIEQLNIWGERAAVPVISGKQGADAAALAFEAMENARAAKTDILLIDTAGRLHNKQELMAELQKIVRVISKQDDTAPHDCILVLDATTGQNAHAQVEVFRELVSVSGLVLTKLDGAARGGVLVALAERFGLPVHAVGVGEGIDDLQPFSPRDFARGLFGLAD